MCYYSEDRMWRKVTFSSNSDDDAKALSKSYANQNHIKKYGLEKITKEKLI